jgi:hypothetical protein
VRVGELDGSVLHNELKLNKTREQTRERCGNGRKVMDIFGRDLGLPATKNRDKRKSDD